MDNQKVIQSLQNAIAKGDQTELLALAQVILAQAGYKVTQPKPRLPHELEQLGDQVFGLVAKIEDGKFLPGQMQAVRLTLWISWPEGYESPVCRLAGYQKFGEGVRVPPNQTDQTVMQVLKMGQPIQTTYPRVRQRRK